MSFVILLVGTFRQERAAYRLYPDAADARGAAAVITWRTMDGQVNFTFSNMYVDDLMGDFLKLMLYLSVAVVLLYSRGYMNDRKMETTEYYVACDLRDVGHDGDDLRQSLPDDLPRVLELLSLALYAHGCVAAGLRPGDRSCDEVFRSWRACFRASCLYGISMLYGATGTLEISSVAQAIYHQAGNQVPCLMFGFVSSLWRAGIQAWRRSVSHVDSGRLSRCAGSNYAFHCLCAETCSVCDGHASVGKRSF
jgi:NADH-quinone oxidoreductase subunit N